GRRQHCAQGDQLDPYPASAPSGLPSDKRDTVIAAYSQDIRSRDGHPGLRDIGNCPPSPISRATPPSASCTSGYSRSTPATPGSEDRFEVHKRCRSEEHTSELQ